MRKLRLDVEALQVESFEAVHVPARRGTVAGHLVEGPYFQDPFIDWEAGGGGGGGGNTVGTCIGPTYCCAETWNCPVIVVPNTASRVVSAIVIPCTCGG